MDTPILPSLVLILVKLSCFDFGKVRFEFYEAKKGNPNAIFTYKIDKEDAVLFKKNKILTLKMARMILFFLKKNYTEKGNKDNVFKLKIGINNAVVQ